MRFPTIETQDLNGRSLTIPRDLAGEFNLLLLGYNEWHQRQYDTWLPFATRLEADYPAFHFYEVPVAGNMNIFGRYVVDEGMRAGIPDPATRARVLTLYVDEARLNRAAGVDNTREITALLVQRDGTIVWRETGAWTPEKADSLDDVLLASTRLLDNYA